MERHTLRRDHEVGQAAVNMPDAPDTRLGLNRIEILESVAPGEGFAGRTGHRLLEILEPLALTATPNVDVRYTVVGTKYEFFKQLDRIEQEAKVHGRKPVLHIEAHGDDEGLEVGAGEYVRWDELRRTFTEINRSTRVSFVVLLAACDGAKLVQLLQPHDRAPFRLLIGPRRDVTAREIEDGCTAFYRTLFLTADAIDAVDAMNAAVQRGDAPFRLCKAETAFEQVMARFIAENRAFGGLNERLHRVMQKARAQNPGASLAQLAQMRGAFGTSLADLRWQHSEILTHFFFLDEFPDDASRYIEVSYDRCVEASRNVCLDD